MGAGCDVYTLTFLEHRVGDLISYHNDGKGRTVMGKRSRELE
jgi:hypothetical protein